MRMKKNILFFVVVLTLFSIACSNRVKQSPQSCVQDYDCVCGGIDKATKQCFVGNVKYYHSGAVDISKDCPDFCTGIAGNLVTKCVENICMNVNKNTFPECSVNYDCVPSSCCHASSCVSKASAPKCEGVFCTQQCAPGTLDCGGSCACEAKRCVTKNLYQQESEVPVI